ncbi:PREDICTED: squamous cell carcinoma antigen recognized by T-cells 3 isoform X2 [Nanorana parkeri]|uniref:squamous cell carcinoma antigen recognized by T-cells 3 isoform X2 n=1 Tax=Nanorana parkeri TaxID=125878 RepID=UPI000854EA41|nr:PREDICTED: squamous cell carcinoma antigen recognized by T-cells 3 isoform X2 [Nanorana parkeri]
MEDPPAQQRCEFAVSSAMAAAEQGLKERENPRLADEGEEEMESEEEEEQRQQGDGSSEESSSGEEDDKECEVEIQRLEEQLSINAFDYNCHVDLIKLLRQEGELERLRHARQKMSELFPLTEEIWLDWLKDEIKIAESEALGRETVYELFEKAVKDYICPEIWLEYAQYSIGGMGDEGGIAKVRSIFERALTAVGLHMTKGSAIWDAFREFENAILGTIQPMPGAVPSSEQQKMLTEQLERIHTLFKRQLGVPLLEMESTYGEYVDWSEEPIADSVVHNYKKALQQVEKYKPYEEALLAAETPKLAEYQAYIDFEMKEGDPARIQLIFERALAENCLVPDLWAKYTQYLDRQLKVKELVLSAHDRASRNCPWTFGLWKSCILAMERHCVDHNTIAETFEKALNAGFIQAADYVEIWQSYLDYLRRRVDFTKDSSKELEELRAAFARALDYLKQEVEERFGESGDPTCSIMQIWARVEAGHCKNMQKARELWDNIMTKGNSKFANMWLEYYNLERAHGDIQHCRKALHRAVMCTSDYPEHVCEVLLTLERIEGTLEHWDTAVQKTESRLSRVSGQRAKAAEKEANLARQEEEKVEQRKRARAEKKAAKKVKKAKPGDKRKAEEEEEEDEEWGEEAEQPSKRHKGDDKLEDDENEEMETEVGLFGRRATSMDRPKPPTTKEQPKVLHNTNKDNITVFVSNLSFNMPDPEKKLRKVFSACGEITDVRVVYNIKGTFRGYCYVEFTNEKNALDALKLDRQEINGRPMFVSPCVDKNKQPDFKVFRYSTSLEKHKLFVSGLPFACTKEEVEEIFKEHGTIKELRLVTNRSGKPKGLAYVEYENEAQASQAVIKLDGTRIKEHTISVAISNPPMRKQTEALETAQFNRPMMPQQTYGARGRGRTQVALLPRSLHRQNAPAATKTENGTPQAQSASSSGGEGEPRKLSNADFVRLLLQK